MDLTPVYCVNFRSAPKIKMPSRFETVTAFEKGENIVLKIPFTGNPKPDYTWYKDNKPLKGSQYKQEASIPHCSCCFTYTVV